MRGFEQMDMPERIEGGRLVLRNPRPGDGQLILPAVQESLAALALWMPWAKSDYGLADAEEWCRRAAADCMMRKQAQYLLFDTSGRHLGAVGSSDFNWKVPCCEIGYWLRTSAVGQGYMTEAARLLCDVLRRQLHMQRIYLRADTRNARSRKLAERIGFQLEGILRHDNRSADGTLRDTCVYAWVADESEQA